MKYAFNIWIPIQNVVKQNSLFYILLSHHIANDDIKTESISTANSSVKQFSSGHKISLLYSPKRIISGVNFNKKKRLVTKKITLLYFQLISFMDLLRIMLPKSALVLISVLFQTNT